MLRKIKTKKTPLFRELKLQDVLCTIPAESEMDGIPIKNNFSDYIPRVKKFRQEANDTAMPKFKIDRFKNSWIQTMVYMVDNINSSNKVAQNEKANSIYK